MPGLTTSLMAALSLALAPAPKEPPPDPLARGYLGIQVQEQGLMIASVEPDTPAAKAGLRPGDEIARVGTLRPQQFMQVVNHICSYRPGSVLEIEVRRGDGTATVKVKLAARPDTIPPPTRTDRLPLPGGPDE